MYKIVENFITNVDDIMLQVKEHEAQGKFTNRGIGGAEKHGTKSVSYTHLTLPTNREVYI